MAREAEEDGVGQCETCGGAYEEDELCDGECDECRDEARAEAEHRRIESHPSIFI
jgi:reverse gyrase